MVVVVAAAAVVVVVVVVVVSHVSQRAHKVSKGTSLELFFPILIESFTQGVAKLGCLKPKLKKSVSENRKTRHQN